MRRTRIQIAKPDIIKLFDSYNKKVLARADIEEILNKNRDFWRLAQSTTIAEFIEFMVSESKLKKVRFKFPSRPMIRYVWGKANIYELVITLKPNCYLSHYSSLYLHELTDQVPKSIYVNFEQRPKAYQDIKLQQERIDWAFKRPVRVTSNIATYQNLKVILLNGMFTGNLGVIDEVGPEGEHIRVTGVERTLIDITVRPVYAGGIFEVLKAYKSAKGKVSINKLAAMLRKMNYIYPYHQAVGFYLEKAGVYKESLQNMLRKFDMNYDFHLAHQMKEVSYSKKWRLYYPKGF